jgi:hypothetical protein
MRGGARGWLARQVPGVRRPSCDGAVGWGALLHARVDATATVIAAVVAADGTAQTVCALYSD